jgi:amidase
MNSDFQFLDATAVADLVRRGQVTPLEVLEQAIAAIEEHNPALNAVVTPMFEQARAAARAPLPEGPFRGVPFLIKDLIASVAGVRLSSGSALFADLVPDHDSALVRRYRAAGLVLVGKTNTAEFGSLGTTEPLFLGKCHNPWARGITPGGSSGGSAAAVAAGLVAMAHGNDGGGSIRIPASCCGVFGLKPTRARISLGPDFSELTSGLVVEHALTRSVRDSAALLDATAGPEPGDPYFAPPVVRPYVDELHAPERPLRIGFSTKSPLGGKVHSECRAAADDAAALCAELGHVVFEKDLTLDAEWVTEAVTAVWAVGCNGALELWRAMTGRLPPRNLVEPFNWALHDHAQALPAPVYERMRLRLHDLSRKLAGFFSDIDIWLTPTLAELPPVHDTFAFNAADPLFPLWRTLEFTPFTPWWNISGQPAASVPLFWSAQGLPIGVQLVGRFGNEAVEQPTRRSAAMDSASQGEDAVNKSTSPAGFTRVARRVGTKMVQAWARFSQPRSARTMSESH